MTHQFHSWVYTQENWKHVYVKLTQNGPKNKTLDNVELVNKNFAINPNSKNVEMTQMFFN